MTSGSSLSAALMAFAKGDAHQGFELLDPCVDDFLAAGDHDRAAAAFFALIYAQLAGGTRQAYAIDVGYRQLPRIDVSAKLLPACVILMASELGCATRYDEAERLLGSVLSMRLPTVDPLGQGYLASARALFQAPSIESIWYIAPRWSDRKRMSSKMKNSGSGPT